MARPLRIEYPGAFYHITARGNERKNIFRDERDRERFLAYLETAVVRYKAVIHVYCLIDNVHDMVYSMNGHDIVNSKLLGYLVHNGVTWLIILAVYTYIHRPGWYPGRSLVFVL